MFPIVLLLACGSPPAVTSVSPSEGVAGTELQVLGERFADDATVELVKGEQVVPLAGATVKGAMLIAGAVPEGLEPGAWTVRVRSGGATAELADALTVAAPQVEQPCSGDWKTNAQVSRAREVVVIDRFGPDEARETHRLPFADIDRVEYELVKLEDEALCSVIYVKTDDGRRYAFDDDTRLNLQPRAYRVGQAIGVKTEITRQDVEGDERPVEED